MRMGTAPGAAWSFPPPTCTSWRVESSRTTGRYLTRGRSPWASVLSHPPASPGTVRPCLCGRNFVFVCFKLNALNLRNCVGSLFRLDRWVLFTCCYFGHLYHMAQSVALMSQPISLHFQTLHEFVNPTFPSLPGLADADENCKRFIDRCMPEAFKKVSSEDPDI